MCLTTVDDNRIGGFGYKVVVDTDHNGPYKSPFFSSNPMMVGVWETADTKSTIHADDGKVYSAGFHIFCTQRDIAKYIKKEFMMEGDTFRVVRVEYRYVLATGMQDGSRCVVALQMRIIEDLGKVADFVRKVKK